MTFDAVDFSDPVVIDAAPGTDLTLTTTENVYIFVPDGLFADTVTLDAFEIEITAGTIIDQNDPLLCAGGCALDSFDLSDDVLLRVFNPVGNLEVHARAVSWSRLPRSRSPPPPSFWRCGSGCSGPCEPAGLEARTLGAFRHAT